MIEYKLSFSGIIVADTCRAACPGAAENVIAKPYETADPGQAALQVSATIIPLNDNLSHQVVWKDKSPLQAIRFFTQQINWPLCAI